MMQVKRQRVLPEDSDQFWSHISLPLLSTESQAG